MRARLGHSQWERRVDSVPFTRPLNYSPVVHARGGVAQDGSWRFFGRGGEGGDAGRVLPVVDRTAGDFGRTAHRVGAHHVFRDLDECFLRTER